MSDKKTPTLHLPKGTNIELDAIGRVIIHFPLLIEAQAFVDWLVWVDGAAEEGTKLAINRYVESRQ